MTAPGVTQQGLEAQSPTHYFLAQAKPVANDVLHYWKKLWRTPIHLQI